MPRGTWFPTVFSRHTEASAVLPPIQVGEPQHNFTFTVPVRPLSGEVKMVSRDGQSVFLQKAFLSGPQGRVNLEGPTRTPGPFTNLPIQAGRYELTSSAMPLGCIDVAAP